MKPGPMFLLALCLFVMAQAADFSIAIGEDPQGEKQVVLENVGFKCRWGATYLWGSPESQIMDFELKPDEVNVTDNTEGTFEYKSIDACADRPALEKIEITYDGEDKKTVRLSFPGMEQDVTFWPTVRYMQLDYLNHRTNMVDQTGYGDTYFFYGGDEWVRPYSEECWSKSYYNRIECGDPADGGSLNYNGYFIMGFYNSSTNIGWGRVMPVSTVSIIKLTAVGLSGFEIFPCYPPDEQVYPATGYVFGVTNGEEEILSLGKALADWANGGERPGATTEAIGRTSTPGNSLELFSIDMNSTIANVRVRCNGSYLLRMYDVNGRELFAKRGNGKSVYPVSLSGLSNGVYLFRITGSSGIGRKKMILTGR